MALGADLSSWPSAARVVLLLVGITLVVFGLAFQMRGTRL
jgi:Tfp pilus assembly protein PilO